MKINVIKKLSELENLEDLKKAENAILNEEKPHITINGDDEGEQLTHVSAAIWIKEEMEKQNIDIKAALRLYTQRVRNSLT